MPIFKIDAAALYIAHNFLDVKRSCNETGYIFIEKSGANDVRLTGMDGHKMINFLLHNANPSGADFKSFGIYATKSVLKTIKPRKDARVFLTLTDGESGAELEANGMTVSLERVYYNFDVSSLWERARKQLSEGLAFIPSVLPFRDVKLFDLSGFFSHCPYQFTFIHQKTLHSFLYLLYHILTFFQDVLQIFLSYRVKLPVFLPKFRHFHIQLDIFSVLG